VSYGTKRINCTGNLYYYSCYGQTATGGILLQMISISAQVSSYELRQLVTLCIAITVHTVAIMAAVVTLS